MREKKLPLTESAKKKNFGNVEPQQMRDWSGPGGALLYEGYATPGISQNVSGWCIIKHSFDSNNFDNESQPKFGLIWAIRTIYDYSVP